MVTGEHSISRLDACLQTTKVYLHHIGSFLFLSYNYKEVIILTSVWRFISMSSHALAAFRTRYDQNPDLYTTYQWVLSYLRQLFVIIIIMLCIIYPPIRRGFGLSASGHVAYLLVRTGPVFRLG